MLNKELLLNRLKELSEDELATLVRNSLLESKIPYESGIGQISYNGLCHDEYEYISPFVRIQKSVSRSVWDITYHVEPKSDIMFRSFEINYKIPVNLDRIDTTDAA